MPRFNAMLQTKSRLESEMIRIETEKLSLKKSLLDVQIDNNKLIEDSESRSMEVFSTKAHHNSWNSHHAKLTNKILALESEIMQMELKSNALSKENFEIKKKWGALEDKNSTVPNLLEN